MPKYIYSLLLLVSLSLPSFARAQSPDLNESQFGAWYMYFFDWEAQDKQWGLQGDTQYRAWNLGDDFQQLIGRGAVTYRPKATNIKLAAGYAYFVTGAAGDSSKRFGENRTHLDINVPQKVASRFLLRHRFRFEQRWVEGQDFRTRWRYALFMNIPLNGESLDKGAIYLSLFDEVFINGEKNIGDGGEVDRFDRNWLYGAMGYSVTDNVKLQGGYLLESTSDYNKGYWQFSLLQQF